MKMRITLAACFGVAMATLVAQQNRRRHFRARLTPSRAAPGGARVRWSPTIG